MIEGISVENKTKRNAGYRMSHIMKFVITLLIILYVAILYMVSGGSSKTFKEVEKPIKSSINTEKMKDLGVQGLKRYYGLNAADYEGVLFYRPEFNLSAEELLMIKVKEDEQVHLVVEAINKRLENRKNDFAGYAPKEVKLLEEAQISVRGKFIFLSVGENADQYKKIFSDSL